MVERTVLGTVGGASTWQRLEVALVRRHDGRVAIELREQHHAEGIGWFDQRCLTLDPRQLRQLQAVLQLDDLPPMSDVDDDAPVILPFPGPVERPRPRPAVGDER